MAELCTDQVEKLQKPKCVSQPDAPVVEWKYKDRLSPYIDRRSCEHCIVVDEAYSDGELVQYDSLGSLEQREQRIDGYIKRGVDLLIEFYNKRVTSAEKDVLLVRSKELYQTYSSRGEIRYYISPRPTTKVKTLVTLPVNLLSEYPESTYTPAYSSADTVVTRYQVAEIRQKHKLVSDVMIRKYGSAFLSGISDGVPSFFIEGATSLAEGVVTSLNLSSEGERLNKFIDLLQEFLRYNEVDVDLKTVPTTAEKYLEFVFDAANYNILDVRYLAEDLNEPPIDMFLRTAWPRMEMNTRQPLISQTTSALIYWANEEMAQMFSNSIEPSWEEFVNRYVYPPRPDLLDSPSFESEILRNTPLERGAQKAAAILGLINYGTGLLSRDESLSPLSQDAIKTATQLLSENNNILNFDFQLNVADQVRDVVHSTGTGPFEMDLSELFDSFGSGFDGLYNNLLNHVDFKYLAVKLFEGLGEPVSDSMLSEASRGIEKFLEKLPDISNVTIPFNFPAESLIFDVTKNLAILIFSVLIEIAVFIITQIVMGLLSQLTGASNEELNYGRENINSLLSNSSDFSEELDSFYNLLSSNAGDGTATSELLRELMNDVSAVLDVSELCSLLQNKASVEVLDVVYGIVLLDAYAPMSSLFSTKKDVASFFSSLGSLVDSSICEFGYTIPSRRICDDGFSEEIRRSLLGRKEGISSEQIEEQINAEKERRKRLLAQMASMFESPESPFTDSYDALINKSGVIGEQIANHSTTEQMIEQVVESVFVAPARVMIEEGMGERETPYDTIEYGVSAPTRFDSLFGETAEFVRSLFEGQTYSEEFPKNRGVMYIISDEGYNKAWSNPVGFALTNAAMPPKLRTRINLSDLYQPAGTPRDIVASDPIENRNWVYSSTLHHSVGAYRDSILLRDGKKAAISYQVDESNTIPGWWVADASSGTDFPVLRTFFINRAPISGFPDSLRRANVEGPVVKYLNAPGTELERLQNDVIDNSTPPDEFINASQYRDIPVFNDLPTELIDGESSVSFADFDEMQCTKQQELYTNFIIEKLNTVWPEGLEKPWNDSEWSSKLARTYTNVFNDVMRILYRFVSDSPLLEDSSELLSSMRGAFGNFDIVLQLLGLEGQEGRESSVKEVIKNKITLAMSNPGGVPNLREYVMKETSLRYLLRIYIFEFLCKNMYALTSVPEKFNTTWGNEFVNDAGATNDSPVNNPALARGYKRMLNIEDIADSTLVSYIVEYILFTSIRDGLFDTPTCGTFQDAARELAQMELEQKRPESGFLSVDGPGDTLAYYPPIDERLSLNRAAIGYYVAKELEITLSAFNGLIYQLFVESKGFPEVSPGESISDTNMRSLMLSFLDKFEIIGHNIDGAPLNLTLFEDPGSGRYTSYWEQNGEGLYMEYYVVRADDEVPDVVFMDRYAASSDRAITDEDTIGLRVCLRGSKTHGYLGRGLSSEGLTYLLRTLFEFDLSEDILALNSYSFEKGVPIITYEAKWGSIRGEVGSDSPLTNNATRRATLDALKEGMIQNTQFKTMFEYIFPVRKLFNYLLMINDQNISAFLTNPINLGTSEKETISSNFPSEIEDITSVPGGFGTGGVRYKKLLNASVIDPEQFTRTKSFIRGIIENLYKS